ncbi:sugar kinase [Streptomyces solicamelliae]|uniref:sugar kinase n=1 Tax=Streptomyces solicamelliae TaxID=3231716 RepID=UPI0038779C9D
MVTFVPTTPGRLADVSAFARTIGGAESNVACALAAAGHRVKWVGRVGADAFGDHLVEAIGGWGVDTTAVARDPDRQTGVYFRAATDRADGGHEVLYYRAGSAASAMSPETVPWGVVEGGRMLHVSGITAALSDGCGALMHQLVAPRPGRPLVSFDVNYRAGLWRGGRAAVLLELARAADVVFVGEDEAEEAWGLRGADAIREALPEPGVLVVKRGGRGAVAYERDSARREGAAWGEAQRSGPAPGSAARTTVPAPAPDTVTAAPAPHVTVVAPVGAGDAFAAGFLSGTLRGLTVAERIRHGHLMAAAALTTPHDLAAPPSRAHADRLVALSDDAWGRLRLGPGWTGEDLEVRTS